MKSTQILKKIIQAMMLLSFLMIVVISCRKDITDPDPAEPWNPGTTIPPDVFLNNSLNIMSDYETGKNMEFPGQRVFRTGTILKGEGKELFDDFGEMSGLLWEIADYKITEGRFDKIDNEIDGLSNQIATLNDNVLAMQVSLNVKFDDLTNQINKLSIKSAIDPIETKMGISDYNQFGWYSNIAAAYARDSVAGAKDMEYARSKLRGFAHNVITEPAGSSMDGCIKSLFTSICPDSNNLSNENAIHDYAKLILDHCHGKVIDSADAMAAYIMLESYFLTIVNYQYQAGNIMVNATNYDYHLSTGDTTGHQGKVWWTTTMSKIIPWEIRIFQDNVDYLLTNLAEYRTHNQFVHDMKYANTGLAPDLIFYNAYGRSQFLCNLLYSSSGNPYPVISGHILVPNRYSTDGSATPEDNQLTVNIGSSQVKSTSKTYATTIPYTYWDNTKTCYPDNHWDTYTIHSPASASAWPSTSQTIQVAADNLTSPWPHAGDITVNVIPKYYNPRHPKQTSPTKNDSCYVQFAYFSVNWQWGYMLLSNTSLKQKLPKYFDLDHYDYLFDNNLNKKSPMSLTWHYYDDTHTEGNANTVSWDSIAFSCPDNYSGTLSAKGHMPNFTSNKRYNIVDSRYLGGVKTSGTVPDDVSTNGTNDIEAWVCYNGSIQNTFQPLENPTMTISVGTYNKTTGDYQFVAGDIIYDVLEIKSLKYDFPTKFNNLKLAKSTSYDPGVQYYYYVEQCNYGLNQIEIVNVELNHAYQYMYTGLYKYN